MAPTTHESPSPTTTWRSAWPPPEDAYDAAHGHYREALRIRRQQLGDTHPQTLETAFAMAQAECEHFDRPATFEPAALADCVADLAANLADYRKASRRSTLADAPDAP
jgi:hypothetical protein